MAAIILKGKEAKKGYLPKSPYKDSSTIIIDFGRKGGNITMEGMDEPLMGVSELGERKYMKPGNVYPFKGQYVKEIPMRNNNLESLRHSLDIYKKKNTPFTKSYKHGGIIVGGVGHNEKNELGDHGVPVVSSVSFIFSGGKYNQHAKTAEIESDEIIFNLETADAIDRLIDEYDDCKCPNKLLELGSIVKEAVSQLEDKTCVKECKFEPKLKQLR